MVVVILLISCYALTYSFMPYVASMIGKTLNKKNYREDYIPVGLGLIFLLVPIPLLLFGTIVFWPDILLENIIFAFIILAFGYLGLIDDTLGNSESRGFVGHFKALVNKELTTGAIKALFGGLSSLFASVFFANNLALIILNTLIISLTANLFNLLDVRPGRSSKFFFISIFSLGFLGISHPAAWLMMFSLLAYIPWDLQAKAMLGDVGANVLGATIGLLLIQLEFLPKLLILGLLIGLHLYSERYSLTTLIQKNYILGWLDNLGRS